MRKYNGYSRKKQNNIPTNKFYFFTLLVKDENIHIKVAMGNN
jgi:hypothetical protein